MDEQLVLERLRKPAPFAQNFQPRPQPQPAVQPTVTAAEEDLLSWLLKSPEHTVLCSELTQEDFSSPGAWKIFEALIRAHAENPQSQDLAQAAAAYVPEQKKELVKLALLQTPEDFNPARARHCRLRRQAGKSRPA